MKHIRQLGILFLMMMVLVGLTGCAAVKGKFTRRKKDEKEKPIFYLEKDYKGPAYTETYLSNFVFWKSWIGELFVALDGDSRKRQLHSYRAAHLSLKKMQDSLKDEFQERLNPYLKQLENIGLSVARGRRTRPQVNRLKRDIAKHKRIVEKKFSPQDVDTWLKEEQPHYEY